MKRCLHALLLTLIAAVCLTHAAAFNDVPAGAWYADTVTAMSAQHLLNGYPDGSFRPNSTISAAEFVSVVARCGGLQPAAPATAHWASGTMQAALDAGWYDWDELPPTGEAYDRPISRQVAVNTLMRALLPTKTGDYSTESAKISDFSQLCGRYYSKVLAAYACGVAQGDNEGRFLPLSSLTRAQACAVIQRALNISGSTPAPEPETPVTSEGGVSAHGSRAPSSAMRTAPLSSCTA